MGFQEAKGPSANPENQKMPFYLSEMEAKLHSVEGQYKQEAGLSHLERYQATEKQIQQFEPKMIEFLKFWQTRKPSSERLSSQIFKHHEAVEFIQRLFGSEENPYHCPKSGEELDYSQDQPSAERLKQRLTFILSYLPEAALDLYRVQCYQQIMKEINSEQKPVKLIQLKNIHTKRYIAWAGELSQFLAEFGYQPKVRQMVGRLWQALERELVSIRQELQQNLQLINFPISSDKIPNPDSVLVVAKAGICAQASVIHLISEKGPVAISVNPNTDLYGATDLVVFDGEEGVDKRLIFLQIKSNSKDKMVEQLTVDDLSLAKTQNLPPKNPKAKLVKTAADYQEFSDTEVKPSWLEMGRFTGALDSQTGCMLPSGNKNGVPEYANNPFYLAAGKDIGRWIDWLTEESS